MYDLQETETGKLKAFDQEMPNALKQEVGPFTFVQADLFGPMMIEGDKKVKRWVLVVICLNCRGIHLGESGKVQYSVPVSWV